MLHLHLCHVSPVLPFVQKKATDPARFTNRGGNLLKEEKQRSELHKSLPKVKKPVPIVNQAEASASDSSLILGLLAAFQLEKKLKAQIDMWECEQGRDFLVNGLKFLQYVEEQWEQQQAEKEREKMARVSQPASSL